MRRDVSNSPFFIDNQRKGATSVEEELMRFLQPHLQCGSHKFTSAGVLRSDLSEYCGLSGCQAKEWGSYAQLASAPQ